MKLLGAILGLLLIILIVIEVRRWALCETYMKSHLDGLVGC